MKMPTNIHIKKNEVPHIEEMAKKINEKRKKEKKEPMEISDLIHLAIDLGLQELKRKNP